jgi:hypothetical protein
VEEQVKMEQSLDQIRNEAKKIKDQHEFPPRKGSNVSSQSSTTTPTKSAPDQYFDAPEQPSFAVRLDENGNVIPYDPQ